MSVTAMTTAGVSGSARPPAPVFFAVVFLAGCLFVVFFGAGISCTSASPASPREAFARATDSFSADITSSTLAGSSGSGAGAGSWCSLFASMTCSSASV
ncbi:hypothetical protein C3481_16060 [Microbacterium sp. Ru50]|nr:hypothetical protein C3481_16060 [Microbacterium sp. Ru50]